MYNNIEGEEIVKRIVDQKTGRKEYYRETFIIGEANSCPHCKRIFKPHDIKALEERTEISCSKCGNRLRRK